MPDSPNQPRFAGAAVLIAALLLWASIVALSRARSELETSAHSLSEQNAELVKRAGESDRLWGLEADRADEFAAAHQALEAALADATRERDRLEQESFHDHIHAAFVALADGDLTELSMRLERVPDEHVGWEWMYLSLRRELALLSVEEHTEPVSALAQSRDGSRVASASRGGGVFIWDRAFEEPLFERGFDEEVSTLALDDAGQVVFCGLRSGALVASHVDEEGGEIANWEGRPRPTATCFFPGKHIVACGFDDGSVAVWDLAEAEPRWLAQHADVVTSIAISADGALFATGSDDKTVHIYSGAEFADVRTLEGHTDWVNCVAFDAAAERIVSGSEDETVRIWDVQTGALLEDIEPGRGPLRLVAIDVNDQLTYVSELGYYEQQDGRAMRTTRIPLGDYELLGLALLEASGERLVYSAGDESVRIWRGDAPPGVVHIATQSTVSCVTSSADRIAAGCRRGRVLVYDARTGEELRQFVLGPHNVLSVSISPDGKWLAAGAENGTTAVWDLNTGAPLHAFEWTPRVTSVRVTNERLLAVGRDGSARLWNLTDGALVHEAPAPRTSVFASAAASDATTYAWVADAGTVRVWDAATGARTAALRDRSLGRVETTQLSSDGTRLALIESAWRFAVFDLATGEAIARAGDIERSAHVLALDSAGERHLTGGFGGTVSLWDTNSGIRLFDLPTGDEPIHALAFSEDGTRIFVGTGAGLQIWETDADALRDLRR